MITVTARGPDSDGRPGNALHPVGGHDLLALPDAVGERELADLQKVARQQPEAGRGTRLAIPADRPFAGTEAHRIEQHAAGIGWQLLARPLGNQAPKNRRRGAAVGPFRAGLADDGQTEDEAEAVGRGLHGDLAVAQVVAVGNGELVPFEAECHVEHVSDGDFLPAGLVAEIGIFGELIVKLGVGRRHLSRGERHAIGQTYHALGHRTQVVQHLRPKDDEVAGAARDVLVDALAVVLEQRRAGLRDQQPMQAAHRTVGFGLRQSLGYVFGDRRRPCSLRLAAPEPSNRWRRSIMASSWSSRLSVSARNEAACPDPLRNAAGPWRSARR